MDRMKLIKELSKEEKTEGETMILSYLDGKNHKAVVMMGDGDMAAAQAMDILSRIAKNKNVDFLDFVGNLAACLVVSEMKEGRL